MSFLRKKQPEYKPPHRGRKQRKVKGRKPAIMVTSVVTLVATKTFSLPLLIISTCAIQDSGKEDSVDKLLTGGTHQIRSRYIIINI